MLKLKMLHFLSGATACEVGETYNFEDEEAIRLVHADIAEPTNKKAFKEAVEKQEKEQQLQKEKEEKAAAILHEEELLKERTKLQIRVDEITNSLGDGVDYYKSYIDLVSDLEKENFPGENSDANNDSKKDDLSKGKGE